MPFALLDEDKNSCHTRQPKAARGFLAEAIGTFALTFVAAGTVMAGALSHGQVDHVAKAIAPGLIVMALIYAFGDVSGAHFNPSRTIVLEAVLTAVLVTVILNSASRHSLIGTDAAIAVGATVALCGLFGATLSGASMNPARSFGPAVVDGRLGDLWLYVTGSFLGAGLAVLIAFALHPRHDREEQVAAQGEPPRQEE